MNLSLNFTQGESSPRVVFERRKLVPAMGPTPGGVELNFLHSNPSGRIFHSQKFFLSILKLFLNFYSLDASEGPWNGSFLAFFCGGSSR